MMTSAIRALYVDDEPDLLNICKLFLEESGDFVVTTTLSAPEAIRLLEEEKFDVIISDYQMPGMNGIQFLVEVRTRFGPIPFILFTGRGREEVVIQAINCGEIRKESCTISITLHREGSDYLLDIADNGIGIPEGIDVTISHTLGLFLIRFIVEHQLRGRLEINSSEGTAYTIRFSEPEVQEDHIDE